MDDSRDALRARLESFEARVRECDPEQRPALEQALEQLRSETKELERLRGVWHQRGLPGVERDWNEVVDPKNTEPPLADARYKAYVEEKEKERNLLRDT